MALSGKVGAIYKQTSDVPVGFTDEATTADAAGLRFNITDETKRYWDKDATFTVKVDGVTQTTGFHLEYAGGVVIFNEEQIGDVTVSGKSVQIAQIGGFFSWTVNPNVQYEDTTCWPSDGWKTQVALEKDWTASAEQIWSVEDELISPYMNGDELIFVFFADSGVADIKWEGYGLIKPGLEVQKGAIVKSSVSITGIGGIYPRNIG